MYYNLPLVVTKFFQALEDVKARRLGTDAINNTRLALQREMKKQKDLLLASQNSAALQYYLAQYAADLGFKQFLRTDFDAWTFDRDTPGLREKVEQAVNSEYSELLLEIAEAQRFQQQQELTRKMEEAQREAERVRLLQLDLVEGFAKRQHERNRTEASDADARIKSAQENVNVLTTTVKDLAGVVVDHAKTVAEGYRTMLQPEIGATAHIANQTMREQQPSEKERRDLLQKQQVFNNRVGCVVRAFIGVTGILLLGLFLLYLAMHAL